MQIVNWWQKVTRIFQINGRSKRQVRSKGQSVSPPEKSRSIHAAVASTPGWNHCADQRLLHRNCRRPGDPPYSSNRWLPGSTTILLCLWLSFCLFSHFRPWTNFPSSHCTLPIVNSQVKKNLPACNTVQQVRECPLQGDNRPKSLLPFSIHEEVSI